MMRVEGLGVGNEKQIHIERERRGEEKEKIAIALKGDLTQIGQSLNIKGPDGLVF